MSISVNLAALQKTLAPRIVSGGGGAVAAYSIDENTRDVAAISAVATAGRPNLIYSIVGGADATKFVINSSTGKLSFLQSQDFEKPSDGGGDNTYNVTIKVSDGVGSDTQSISVVVKDVNEAPVITSNGGSEEATILVTENSTDVTKVTAQDPDGGSKLVHSIAGGADASKFTIDAATGALKFVAAPDYENAKDAGANNIYDVIVKTTDGKLSDTQSLHVKVTDVAEPQAAGTFPAGASTVTVSNAVELMNALKSAKGGETILLKAADYGSLNLSSKSGLSDFLSQVTIKSVDSTKPAIFHSVNFTDVNNVKFDGVKLDHDAKVGESLSCSPFNFVHCSGITVTNSQITGDVARGISAVDDGFGTGRGLGFSNSSNIEVSNNTITEFYRAVVFSGSSNIKVTGNDISNMSSDGLNFSGVKNVLVDNNHIHDFFRNENSLAHPDMIQFWTAGNAGQSSNVVISNNFLDVGSGTSTQSIFMRNEAVDQGLAGREMFYQNLTIANNLVSNTHNNGITVGATDNLTIDNNTLIQKRGPDDSWGTGAPRINVADNAINVKITDNVLAAVDSRLDVAKPGWIVSNNQVVQSISPDAANYAGKIYADFLDTTSSSISDYRLVPGSFLDKLGAGSTLTNLSNAAGVTGFLKTADVGQGAVLAQSFDATNVYSGGVKLNLAGAKVVWDFGDKTVGSGLTTQHVYVKPGTYEATATITLADNKVVVIDKTITVVSDHLLNLNFNSSFADRSADVNDFVFSKVSLAAGPEGDVLRLNGGNIKYSTDTHFFGNSEFSVLADFKKDAGAASKGGTLFYFSKVVTADVSADGVRVYITTNNGVVELNAKNAGLANSDWHKLAVTFSGDKGFASLYIDGKLATTAAVKIGSTQLEVANSDFYVGSPFGQSFVGSVDNVHYISDALTAKNVALAQPAESWAQAAYAPQAAAAIPHDYIANVGMPNDINLF